MRGNELALQMRRQFGELDSGVFQDALELMGMRTIKGLAIFLAQFAADTHGNHGGTPSTRRRAVPRE